MARLYPTPTDRLTDAKGRPYFLWDIDMTLDEFKQRLRESGREGLAYLVGKLMRQAKPDDVFTFVSVAQIVDLWPLLERYLGRERAFWRWLLVHWGCELEAA
jgi:hypothetical protein